MKLHRTIDPARICLKLSVRAEVSKPITLRYLRANGLQTSLGRINSGFTLIELMVTVAIIGILAAIAMPSYSNYVIKGSRTAAQTQLLELASLQEKVYLNSNAYTAVAVGTAYNGTLAGGLGKTGGTTADGKYTFDYGVPAPAQTFIIRAIPVAGKTQVGDGCLTIQENGLKYWYKTSDACAGATTDW